MFSKDFKLFRNIRAAFLTERTGFGKRLEITTYSSVTRGGPQVDPAKLSAWHRHPRSPRRSLLWIFHIKQPCSPTACVDTFPVPSCAQQPSSLRISQMQKGNRRLLRPMIFLLLTIEFVPRTSTDSAMLVPNLCPNDVGP